MEVRMDLSRIIISDNSDQQIIVLKERDGDRSFSIVIGETEAMAIDRRIKGIRTARPLTHDLLSRLIESLGGELERIVINDLKDHTFFAKLVVRQNGGLIDVDSRPSDAIAVGVASDTPIYVAESVLRDVC